MLPSLSNLHVCNVPKSAPVAVPGHGPGRDKFEFVPRHQLINFVKYSAGRYLLDHWEWDFDREFPIVSMLENEYGKGWQEYIERREDGGDVTWYVHHKIDDKKFDEMMIDFLGEWRDLDTKDEIDLKILDFYKSISRKIDKLGNEGDYS